MIPKDGLDLNYLRAALRRRFWYLVVPFFFLAMATIVYCIVAPKIYMSSALILIQPQEVPMEYVQPTVTTNIQARLKSITEQVMSRSKLEEVIKKHDLYPKIRATSSMYNAVEEMRQKITIDIDQKQSSKSRGEEPAAFQISFEGKYPAQVRDVTAELAELFIDFNYRLRAEQAAGTTKFLDRQLERMKEELRQKEELVRKFKEENMGLLPEQMQNNYNILTQLQQHMDSINDSVQKTEDRKVLLQTQLSKLETLDAAPRVTGGESTEPLTLEQLRQQLQLLKSRYSERHPDVIRLNAAIAKMETEPPTSQPDTPSGGPDVSLPPTDAQRLVRVQREDLLVQLKLVDKEILSLHQEKKKTSEQIEAYKQRIESGPMIEQMFVDLRRDYQRADENYQSLLQKKLQAELAENLERTQKGEQFKILDTANLPAEPEKPKIPKILALGFVLAISCGLGLVFLREYLDPTFWSRKEVESALGLPILVSIPLIITAKDRRWRRLKMAGTVCALLVMSSTLLYALFVLLKRNPTLLPI